MSDHRTAAEMIANYARIRNHFFLRGPPSQKRKRTKAVAVAVTAEAIPAAAPAPAATPAAAEPPELSRAAPRQTTIEDIARAVCDEFQITRIDLWSERRTLDIVTPRHICFALCKHLTLRSFPVIGQRLGNRDHSTVIHAVRKLAPYLEAAKDGMPHDATPAQWVRVMRECMGDRGGVPLVGAWSAPRPQKRETPRA